MDGDKFLPDKPLGMDHGTNGVVINRLMAYDLILDFNFMPTVEKHMAELDDTRSRMVLTLNLMKELSADGKGVESEVGAVRMVVSADEKLYNECLSYVDPFSTSPETEELLEDLAHSKEIFINQLMH